MKRSITVAVLLVGLAIPAAAQAAPSMYIDNVVAPTGSAETAEGWQMDGRTTWHLGVSGTDAWATTECTSTAWHTGYGYALGEDYTDRVAGEDMDPNGFADSWSFAADTLWNYKEAYPYTSEFVPLSHVTATCTLRRKSYVGRRYYREMINPEKQGPSAFARGGCPVYSYSTGKLTIDCRYSTRSGFASWRIPLRSTDRVRGSTVWFDRSQSTIGRHVLRSYRWPRHVVLTETVSPGTMITVNSVEAKVSRRYSKQVWRNESKTLRAAWPS